MTNRTGTHDYEVLIDAPLDEVWQVLAVRFEHIGQWASGVPRSWVAEVPTAAGAPVGGRVCASSWRGFDDVTETIVEYGEKPHFFTYQASGTPAWMGVARNSWHAEEAGEATTLVYFEPVIEPAGPIGRLLVPLFVRFARKLATNTLDDLKVYIETGKPSKRKQEKSSSRGATRIDRKVGAPDYGISDRLPR